MVYQKKKICLGSQTRRVAFGVPFLCVLLLASGGWIAVASRQTGAAAGQRTENGAASPSVLQDSSLSSDPDLSPGPSVSLGSGELFFKMMLSVGLVLGLGGAALYLSRRVLPKVTQRGGKEIHILETACLGPRKALHLVEVGGQRLLIASTNDHVTMLTPLNDTWLDVSKPELDEAVKT